MTNSTMFTTYNSTDEGLTFFICEELLYVKTKNKNMNTPETYL